MGYGERFKDLRLAYYLSQETLAKQIGTSQQNISRWEKNEVEPSISFCIAMADFYRITLDELVGRDVENDKK